MAIKTRSKKDILITESFKAISENIRKRSSSIFTNILSGYHPEKRPKKFKPRCIFCWSKTDISREHLLPRWLFEHSDTTFFTSRINFQDIEYDRSTVPACKICNTQLLSKIEKHISSFFNRLNDPTVLIDKKEIAFVIRWLEIVDYKFQVWNLISRFLRHKHYAYDKKVASIPLAMLRRDAKPDQVINQLWRSILRIGSSRKTGRLKSFILYKCQGKEFNFFHKMNDYIFLELPAYNLSFFYFFKKRFLGTEQAHNAAYEIIKKYY